MQSLEADHESQVLRKSPNAQQNERPWRRKTGNNKLQLRKQKQCWGSIRIKCKQMWSPWTLPTICPLGKGLHRWASNRGSIEKGDGAYIQYQDGQCWEEAIPTDLHRIHYSTELSWKPGSMLQTNSKEDQDFQIVFLLSQSWKQQPPTKCLDSQQKYNKKPSERGDAPQRFFLSQYSSDHNRLIICTSPVGSEASHKVSLNSCNKLLRNSSDNLRQELHYMYNGKFKGP